MNGIAQLTRDRRFVFVLRSTTTTSIPRIQSIQRVNRFVSTDSVGKSDVQTAMTKLKAALAPFMSGSKSLWADYKKMNAIKREYGIDLNTIGSRAEIRHVRETTAELKKAAPVLIAFWIPIVGYTIPVVCLLFPAILPKALKQPEQREADYAKWLKDRVQLSDTIEKGVKDAMSSEYTTKPFAEHIKLADYAQSSFLQNIDEPIAKQTIPELFDTPVERLTDPSVDRFLRYLGLKGFLPAYFARHKLKDYLKWIRIDDVKIRQGGIDSLSDEEVKQALFDRGYDTADLTPKESREALLKWVAMPTYHMNDSLLLHNMTLRKHLLYPDRSPQHLSRRPVIEPQCLFLHSLRPVSKTERNIYLSASPGPSASIQYSIQAEMGAHSQSPASSENILSEKNSSNEEENFMGFKSSESSIHSQEGHYPQDEEGEISPNDGFQIDQFLMNALVNFRDRLTILKLDSELEKFINNPRQTKLMLPPQSSYQRLIVHRVAQYFQLEHIVVEQEPGKRAVALQKTPDSRVPILRFSDLVEQPEAPPTSNKSFKIMRRDRYGQGHERSSTTSESQASQTSAPTLEPAPPRSRPQGPSAEMSYPAYSTRPPSNPNMTLEEREEEYAKARARIFGPEKETEEGIDNSPLTDVTSSLAATSLDDKKKVMTSAPLLMKNPTEEKDSIKAPVVPPVKSSIPGTAPSRTTTAPATSSNSSGPAPTNPQSFHPRHQGYPNYNPQPVPLNSGFYGNQGEGGYISSGGNPWSTGKPYDTMGIFNGPFDFGGKSVGPMPYYPGRPSFPPPGGFVPYPFGQMTQEDPFPPPSASKQPRSNNDAKNKFVEGETDEYPKLEASRNKKNNATSSPSTTRHSTPAQAAQPPQQNVNYYRAPPYVYYPSGPTSPVPPPNMKGNTTTTEGEREKSAWPTYNSANFRNNGVMMGGGYPPMVQNSQYPMMTSPILQHPPFYHPGTIPPPNMQMSSGHANSGTIYIGSDDYQRRPPKPSATLFDPNAPTTETNSKNKGAPLLPVERDPAPVPSYNPYSNMNTPSFYNPPVPNLPRSSSFDSFYISHILEVLPLEGAEDWEEEVMSMGAVSVKNVDKTTIAVFKNAPAAATALSQAMESRSHGWHDTPGDIVAVRESSDVLVTEASEGKVVSLSLHRCVVYVVVPLWLHTSNCSSTFSLSRDGPFSGVGEFSARVRQFYCSEAQLDTN
ncbi:hypothetical protein PROFUN_07680 [Planoprotostelium fungivorum]|uniref:Uncharacterized protein n=1 Tax=Planoprotostelium fungivorum TaxID=1890364 RepID=A0A2P6MM60_9EUKA|nr:hypothetical protein PROFUN_07680 [Planoprotostelium fungivorum]